MYKDAFSLESLEGKNAVITGSSSGIGRGIALEMAKRGANLFVMGLEEEGTWETVRMIREMGGKAEGFVFDVRDDAAIDEFVCEKMKKYGGIDIFVNNAGLSLTQMDYLETTDEENDAMIKINLYATIRFTKRVIAQMLEHKRGGSILITSSINGFAPVYVQAVYSATKAALINLTKSLAYHYGPDGIRVNCIAPGAVHNGHMPPDAEKNCAPRIPLRRFGVPEDIAQTAAFLVSDAAAYITGTTITIDGGMSLRRDLFE